MPKTRDVIYMTYESEKQAIHSYGIEFREFVNSLPCQLNNVLLLKSRFSGKDFHMGLLMEFARKENLDDLLKDDVYGYGDFCWVDFETVESLDVLDRQEIAEILYLGHFKDAMESPFFNILNNRFAYLAHDDGWYNKTYVRNVDEYRDMLCNLLPLKLQIRRKRRIDPITQSIGDQLLSFAERGLLLDFQNIIRDPREIGVYGHVIGKNHDHDDIYGNMERHKCRAELMFSLVFKNKEWKIKTY